MTTYADPIASLLASYWSEQGLLLSKPVLDHEKFLLQFAPTSDLDRDVAAFLVGVGQRHLLSQCRRLGLNLPALAQAIRQAHREELARLSTGDKPRWPGYQRWSPEQLTFYEHLVELESYVLASIIELAKRRE
ncbi:MAG TPA: hypothetical protein VMR18_00985 [Candidatus Saccharimonadales bacterium]|jgi:hypothetical protein|nr:hypothetical protein [Candidatus Saccharimonadales bacterium]